ncbi:MAG: FtsX-like permease family protein [Clostridia bacterium]
MLHIVMRKILNNKWLILCLLIGCILAVAVVSSIPMYSDAILQRMLTKEFENFQETKEEFPSTYKFTGTFGVIQDRQTKTKLFEYYNHHIENNMATSLPMDIIGSYALTASRGYTSLNSRDWDQFYAENVSNKPVRGVWTSRAVIYGLSGLEDLMKVIGGRMYSHETPGDGIYEVVVSSQAMRLNNYVLDGVYTLTETIRSTESFFQFRVVGVVEMQEEKSTYYYIDNYGIYMEPNIFKRDFVDPQMISIAQTEWYYAYDFYQLRMKDAGSIFETFEENHQWIQDNHGYLRQSLSFMPMLEEYAARSNQLSVMLILLIIPVLVMIGFYISMIAQLIMDQEKNEIAMLESRGASRKQIFTIYLYESLFIGVVSLGLGLLLGVLMCRLLGAANGFMEFVNRSAMDVYISQRAFLYGLACISLYILMMLIPAFKASKFTIVQFKQGKAILDRKPFWYKMYLDVILLVVSLYALANYNKFKEMVTIAEQGQIDYLVFFSITFFILGLALVFLRIYPYLVNLVFRLGKRIWTPSMYAAFTYVGRGGNMRQFIMIFLILALGVGIFNANSARTINENNVDKLRFENGADIRMSLSFTTLSTDAFGNIIEVADTSRSEPEIFRLINSYEGVDNLTRVASVPTIVASRKASASRQMQATVTAIVPEEYGKVAWSRHDLMDVNINFYLNLLAQHPDGVIVSREMAENLDLVPGDFLEIVPSDRVRTVLEAPVIAIVDNWPTYNKYVNPATGKVQDGQTTYGLCIMHMDLLRINLRDLNYEIWVDKADGILDSEFNAFLIENEISLLSASYTDFQISEIKRQPMLLGLNGILTLNFLVIMIICGAGFIIFWILSIHQRVLQFGIFRAMGLKKRELISMIIWEQLLISAVAIILGIVISGVTSDVFVPLFQIAEASEERILDFIIFSNKGDYARIYAVVGAMLVVGVAVISRFINKIRIDQAVKLGED